MNIICKLFGHRIVGLQTKQHFAWCKRCEKGLKVSYDMGYGQTLVTGDYGNQKTFCWCDCGNELCSTNSYMCTEDLSGDIVWYKCFNCGKESKWNFSMPIPVNVTAFNPSVGE